MLNSDSPIPLYHQLADIILAKVRAGEYPPGSKIPSEHGLAATYRIGRPTVRQATDLLVRKRVLIRRRGSGTFVSEEQKEIDLFSLGGTMSSFSKKGISIRTRLLEKARLKKSGGDSENPFANAPAFFLSRLSTVEDVPVLVEDIYLHATLFSGIEKMKLSGRSLSQVVANHFYMRPVGGKQNFRIGFLAGAKAKHLAVSPETPILAVKRYLHFTQSQNAIYSELYCRTDQFVFSQNIGGIADV